MSLSKAHSSYGDRKSLERKDHPAEASGKLQAEGETLSQKLRWEYSVQTQDVTSALYMDMHTKLPISTCKHIEHCSHSVHAHTHTHDCSVSVQTVLGIAEKMDERCPHTATA